MKIKKNNKKKSSKQILRDIVVNVQPHPKQIEFMNLDGLVNFFIAGIGTGKSWIVALIIIINCLMFPGIRCMIGAPTFKMLRNATLLNVRKMLNQFDIPYHDNKKDIITLFNGSEIHYYSLDNIETNRGAEFTIIALDELSFLETQTEPNKGYKALDICIGRLRQVNENAEKVQVFDEKTQTWVWKHPPYRPYKIYVSTTPKGRNWIWECLVKNKKDFPDFKMVRCSSYENPYLPDSYLKSLETLYKGNFFLQEVLAEFTAFEGMIYDVFNEDIHVISKKQIQEKIDKKQITEFVLAKDWGFDPDEGTTLVIGIEKDRVNGNKYYVIEEVYERKKYVESWWLPNDKKIKEKYIKMGLRYKGLYADPSSSAYNDMYRKEGFLNQKVDNSIKEGIEAVHAMFSAERLFYCETCVNGIKETLNYQWLDNGNPMDKMNHFLDPLRYAIYSIEGKPKPKITNITRDKLPSILR